MAFKIVFTLYQFYYLLVISDYWWLNVATILQCTIASIGTIIL